MKKLFCLSLLISALSYSQDNYLAGAVGFDLHNAVIGSQPTNNKPALNATGELLIVDNNHETTIGYEAFPAINFNKAWIGYGYHFNWPWNLNIAGKEIPIKLIPRLEAFMLKREINDDYHWAGYNSLYDKGGKPTFIGLDLNLITQWDVSDNFSFQLAWKMGKRPDLVEAYNDNAIKSAGYVKFVYKFKLINK